MEPFVDDIGSFPLPQNVKRETFAQAYLKAREAIINGKDPTDRRVHPAKLLPSRRGLIPTKNSSAVLT